MSIMELIEGHGCVTDSGDLAEQLHGMKASLKLPFGKISSERNSPRMHHVNFLPLCHKRSHRSGLCLKVLSSSTVLAVP
jgi:hypothetical protein